MLNRFFTFLQQIVNYLSATAVVFALSGAVVFGFVLVLVLTIVRPRNERSDFRLFAGAVALVELLFALWHDAFDGFVPALTFPVITVAAGYLMQLVLEETRKARLSARAKREYRKVEKVIDREL